MVVKLEDVISQVEKLSSADKQQLLEYLQAEAEFDEQLIRDSVGDVLKEDGTIDFDILYKHGKSGRELSEYFPDHIDENGHIISDDGSF